MRFIKLIIENYKSFQFSTEINFEKGSSENPIFLIGGMNNAGKSAIVEAIHYCLYGVKQEKLFPDINRKEFAKGNSFVKFELTFETDDLEEIVVQRSWNAGANENPRPRDLIEKLVVVKNGQRVSTQTQEIWQDFINNKIPQSIARFFFFDGEKIQEIAREEHTEVRLKNSLEAVLGIEHLRRLADDVTHIKHEKRRNFVDITDADIQLREKELEVLRNKLKNLDEQKDELDSEINSMNEELLNSKKRFDDNFGVDLLEQDVVKQKEKRRSQLYNLISQLDNEINNLLDKHAPFALSGTLFPEIIQQIKAEAEGRKSSVLIETADSIAFRITESIEEPPPIFEQDLTTIKKEELHNRIVKVLKAENKTKDIETTLNLSEREAAKILNKIEEVERSGVSNITELLTEKEDFENELQALEKQLRISITSETEKELFDQLQAEIESYATQIGKKKEEARVAEESIILQRDIIEQKELELNKLYEKHIDSEERRNFIEECDAISNLLNNFIVRLRTFKINHLKEKTYEMYRRLASKGDLISEIRIDERTYEVTIIDKDKNIVKKAGLSAGEKEIFAISLLWGLAQTSEATLPIMIDTPLSRLDTVHRENIVKNYFPNAGSQVIILSTDTEITEDYYNLLKPCLSGDLLLKFDNVTATTSVHKGYFWS
jgi:DNA sulfur modification protein DndD